MRIVLTTPCAVMNTLLNHILFLILRLPLTTSMGLKRDTTIAGMMPHTNDITRSTATVTSNISGDTWREILVLSMSLNTGSRHSANSRPMMKQADVNNADSLKYLTTTPHTLSPNSRRVAISLARFPACATVRLI